MRFFLDLRYHLAVLFNTMFAILSSVTLIGIVFITRPQQVMSNVAPSWWLPITLIMAPSQCAAQLFTWRTVVRLVLPTPLAISGSQPAIPLLLRPAVSLLWAANFLIGFIIVVSLYKPNPGQDLGLRFLRVFAFITFALTSFANVFLIC